jgi:Tol biopolymer transport system component/DNA-binding winged helix-turn-helix (wHTH) protein
MQSATRGWRLRFAQFELDLGARELLRDGRPVRIQPQPLRVLEILVVHPGKVVSREELRQRIWDEATFVEFDQGLNYCIRQIRLALGDDAANPMFVETLKKRGYRFAARVEEVGEVSQAGTAEDAGEALAAQTGHHWRVTPTVVAVLAGVLGLAAMSLWWSFRSNAPSRRWPQVSHVSLITAYPGNEAMPAVSTDGNWVAFQWQRERTDRADIYVTRSDGAEQPRRLTHDASDDTADAFPAWSPHGSEVAFVRRRGRTAGEIILVPAQGGEERKLREIRLLSFPASNWLTWTPDGRQIVFASASPDSGRSTLFSIRLTGGQVKSLTAPPNGVIGDAAPVFSPDGRSLAFLRWSSPTVSALLVQKIGADGEALGEPTLVPGTGVAGGSPRSLAWADDRRLVFTEGQRILEWEAGAEIEQIYMSSSTLAGIAIAGRNERGVPRLITAQQERPAPDIWKIPLRRAGLAAGPPAPFSQLGNDSRNPDYSRDGKRLVFVSGRTGNPELWIADPDGGNARQLTMLGLKSLGVPRWSPDSRHVAFFARKSTEPQIFVIDAMQEHAVPRQVTDEEPGCNIPTWSNDGKSVYCSRRIEGEMRLYRVPFGNGAAEPAKMERWFEGKEANETSDGRVLYVKDDRPGLFVRSLAGDPIANPDERLVTDIQGPIAYLAPVAEGVYYTAQDPPGTYVALRFFDYARKESVEVEPSAITGPVNSLAVSPDGRSLVYTRPTRSEINLALLQF